MIIERNSRKKKKLDHGMSDLDVHIIPDEHNRKHRRHRCHHRHSDSSRDKVGRAHKQTCPKHRMSLKAAKVVEEPFDEDSGRSSQRRMERSQAKPEHDSDLSVR
jgi:hypothetical protein